MNNNSQPAELIAPRRSTAAHHFHDGRRRHRPPVLTSLPSVTAEAASRPAAAAILSPAPQSAPARDLQPSTAAAGPSPTSPSPAPPRSQAAPTASQQRQHSRSASVASTRFWTWFYRIGGTLIAGVFLYLALTSLRRGEQSSTTNQFVPLDDRWRVATAESPENAARDTDFSQLDTPRRAEVPRPENPPLRAPETSIIASPLDGQPTPAEPTLAEPTLAEPTPAEPIPAMATTAAGSSTATAYPSTGMPDLKPLALTPPLDNPAGPVAPQADATSNGARLSGNIEAFSH